MTPPKTEPKPRKPAAPSRQPTAPVATTEAFTRLNQKLDALASTLRDQSALTQQAFQAILAQLERQATLVTPASDSTDLLDQLKDLQDQQQNLQSQFNMNRLSP